MLEWQGSNLGPSTGIIIIITYLITYFLLTYLITSYLLTYLLTSIDLSLGGSSPHTSTDKTNKNKYT
jgi:hypothetical protein